MSLPTSTPAPMLTRPAFHHRGFELDIQGSAAGFAFAITHAGLTLHASAPSYRTATSADRAARQFVDDALGAFSYSTQALAA